MGVSADGPGSVYISGGTYGSLGGPNAGFTDAFVSKYDEAGGFLWTRQLGSQSYDDARGISANEQGNVYISGLTFGNLVGPNWGGEGAFVAKIVDRIVPEPSGLALSMAGMLGLIVGGRRRWGKTLTAR